MDVLCRAKQNDIAAESSEKMKSKMSIYEYVVYDNADKVYYQRKGWNASVIAKDGQFVLVCHKVVYYPCSSMPIDESERYMPN